MTARWGVSKQVSYGLCGQDQLRKLTSLYASGAVSFPLPLPSDLEFDGLLPISLAFRLRLLGPAPAPTRCSPAFSLSSSSHERIVANKDNISKRFGSARGVVMNCNRMLDTRRLSEQESTSLLGERRRPD